MKDLKEKYIKLSNLFTIGFFRTYLEKKDLHKPDEVELYNFIKDLKGKTVSEYFDNLFSYIEKHQKKAGFHHFLEHLLQEMIHVAKEQLEFVTHELEKFEAPEEVINPFEEGYEKLITGYYCSLEELESMLNYFSKREEFEKCSQLNSIKQKYYQAQNKI